MDQRGNSHTEEIKILMFEINSKLKRLNLLLGVDQSSTEILQMSTREFFRAHPKKILMVRAIWHARPRNFDETKDVTVGDLIGMTENDFLLNRMLGPKCLNYIKQCLAKYGLAIKS